MDRPTPTRIPGPGVLPRKPEGDVVFGAVVILSVGATLFLLGLQLVAWLG